MIPTPSVLREYALLADGQRGAVIGPRGEIVWLCVPRWDSESVFAGLLGGEGQYTVRPADRWFVPGGFYEEGSLIWRSRWRCSEGTVECREAMAMPGLPDRVVLLRRVLAVEGDAEVEVILDPRADFGRRPMHEPSREGGHWLSTVGDLHLRWSGCPEARPSGKGLTARLKIPAGEFRDLVLELAERPLNEPPTQPHQLWEATEHRWRAEVPRLDGFVGTRDARQAYAVLRGLTNSRGAMVAAATTSLPERARTGRNYDYRYCWIRDQCFTGQALSVLGDDPLFDAQVDWITERVLADGARLRPVYTGTGEVVPGEQGLDRLPGYPGGRPKVGNSATEQFQLDALGEALLLLASAGRNGRFDNTRREAVSVLVDAIGNRWTEPDTGVWETADDTWAHSRLICAAGLRAVAAIEPGRGESADWSSLADTIVAHTGRHCVHPTGRWQRSPGDSRVDAALLLPGIRGVLPADDPRTVATLDAVRGQLTEDGYVYRFRHDERPLHAAEGAFLMCGFITALACLRRGEHEEAMGWFERSRSACGPPGLYSEEYDVVQRQLRGNLPQAFVHSFLLETSYHLSQG
ncbi:glycosyl hydrolase, glucoamylase [Saccharomonospora marina XMU15]|uniref:Glycosyl hydrolase, glucoamylase n=1 Tax=Saccharomonospora marina XMU15 TaxID=882083 RepID=H5WW94_9PSEU|nr:glycosyl hydrolase, glucoamylase [Saccharomonospora marina XMU15]